MSKLRTWFAISWLMTMTLLLIAGFLEHRVAQPTSFEEMLTAVEVLTLAAAIGTIGLTIITFKAIWRSDPKQTLLAAFGLACSPFIVGGILTLSGAEPNIHGASIGGLLLYGFLCVSTAAILIVATGVREILARNKN